MKLNQIHYILLAIFVLAVNGCEKKIAVRHYQEITLEPPEQVSIASASTPPMMRMGSDNPQLQTALQQSVAAINLAWETPKGWNEEKGSGMRMASFTTVEKDPITCTIVSLGGMAGGLESNIVRWMQQVHLNPDNLPHFNLADFMARQEKIKTRGKLDVTFIDLTSLQKESADNSILGGILQIQDTTVFVKMTGSVKAINLNREKFKNLCASLRLNE